jgi:hypothetical protein
VQSNAVVRFLIGVCASALLFVPSIAQASPSDEHPTELLVTLGVGVNRASDAAGLAIRFGASGSYWLTSNVGVGLQVMGFDNIASWATSNIACQANQPCYSGDPRNRSGWLIEPRFLVGTSVSILRFYAAAGVGIAREDVPVTPSQSYFSAVGSLAAGVSVHLSRFSIVPEVRLDAMDAAASALLELGIGANF